MVDEKANDPSRSWIRFAVAGIMMLGASVVFLAAAQEPGRSGAKVTRYLIVSGDSSSGSWDSRDEARLEIWRAQYGSHFAWFRQDGRDYIISDEHTLAEIESAMAPQREVNRQQGEVNRHQGEVNRRQEIVNRHQGDVNRAQQEVNRQQALVNQGAGRQDDVNKLQSEVNEKQQTVNAEQEKVNQQQAVVNREQEAVNRTQARVSVEIERALQVVFDSARGQGVAHETHQVPRA
jgi:hypothetical protein